MSMIQANSQKKSCYSDYKSYTRKSEIVDSLQKGDDGWDECPAEKKIE